MGSHEGNKVEDKGNDIEESQKKNTKTQHLEEAETRPTILDSQPIEEKQPKGIDSNKETTFEESNNKQSNQECKDGIDDDEEDVSST